MKPRRFASATMVSSVTGGFSIHYLTTPLVDVYAESPGVCVVSASAVAETCVCVNRSVPANACEEITIGLVPFCEMLGRSATWNDADRFALGARSPMAHETVRVESSYVIGVLPALVFPVKRT